MSRQKNPHEGNLAQDFFIYGVDLLNYLNNKRQVSYIIAVICITFDFLHV